MMIDLKLGQIEVRMKLAQQGQVKVSLQLGQIEVYLKLGKGEKALEAWKEALKFDPENKDIKEKIEKGIM